METMENKQERKLQEMVQKIRVRTEYHKSPKTKFNSSTLKYNRGSGKGVPT